MDGHSGIRHPARQLRLALAQIDVTVGDLSGNVARILAAAREARAAGATVVLAPELAIPGYPPEDLLLKPSFVSDNLRALDDLRRASAELSGVTLITGFVDREDDLYNAAAIIREGELLGVYHKQYLPNYSVFDEDRYFSAGRSAPTFVIDGVHVGVSICEDIWYPTARPRRRPRRAPKRCSTSARRRTMRASRRRASACFRLAPPTLAASWRI